MGGDGVSDISVGAGEGVGGVVNGASLTLRSIAGSGACKLKPNTHLLCWSLQYCEYLYYRIYANIPCIFFPEFSKEKLG